MLELIGTGFGIGVVILIVGYFVNLAFDFLRSV